MSSCSPQNFANTAWAFARAGHAAPALFDAIAIEAAMRVGEFTPQNLANTAYAFAKAGNAAPLLSEAIAAEAAMRVGEFNAQALANTAWAFATASHAAPALFEAIAAGAVLRAGEFNAQELASTAWAFATAGHAAPALFEAIAAEAALRVCKFNAQNLANLAWRMAAADTRSPAALVRLFGPNFGRRCDELADSFLDKGLSQLQQWWLWYALEQGQTAGLPSCDLLQRCCVALPAEYGRPSELQGEVGSTLTSLGLWPRAEVRIAEGYRLDFVVEWCGGPVAFEVDGPSHFVGRKPNGATLLKRRQLRYLSWHLVSIPYWEWDEIAHAPATGVAKEVYPSYTPAAVVALRERQRLYIAWKVSAVQ
jgi:hypothetical protein